LVRCVGMILFTGGISQYGLRNGLRKYIDVIKGRNGSMHAA